MKPLTERRRKELATLGRRRGRDELGQCLVEGLRSVTAAIDAGAPVLDVVVSESAREQPEIASVLARAGAPVWRVHDRILSRLSDVQSSQGVLAAVQIRRMPETDVAAAGRLLILDGVQDPGNVGTMMRTAAWFGVDAVVAGPGTADPFGPKVVRASMGALWDVGLAESRDPADLIRGLRSQGREAWMADMQGIDVAQWRPAENAVLVLGSEAHGPSAAVRDACTGSVTVPSAGAIAGTESLNVAAAAAVLTARWTGAV